MVYKYHFTANYVNCDLSSSGSRFMDDLCRVDHCGLIILDIRINNLMYLG